MAVQFSATINSQHFLELGLVKCQAWHTLIIHKEKMGSFANCALGRGGELGKGRADEEQLERRKKKKGFIGDTKEECFQQCLGRGGQRFMGK